MTIISKSPTRVDLAGGTLDIMPLTHILGPKKTINFGVTLTAEVKIDLAEGIYNLASHDQKIVVNGSWEQVVNAGKIRWLEKILGHFWAPELPPLRVDVTAKSPAGAGLGGSSCLGIAMARGLLEARRQCGAEWILDETTLIQTVQDLETALIRVPTGCQDYWGGLRGGINIISYPPGGAHVETLRSNEVSDLDDLLLLCYSGVSRASASNNWAIFRKAFEGDRETLGILEDISDLSLEVADAVKANRWDDVFLYSSKEWELRRLLWPDIETPETLRIASRATEGGAVFSRVCGAGGGGVMAIFAEKKDHPNIANLISKVGGTLLNAKVSWEGACITGELN